MKLKRIMHKNAKDLTGKRFGEWTVLYRGPNSLGKSGRTRYFCRCSCGVEALVFSCNLSLDRSRGCKTCVNKRKSNFHGMSGSKTYSVYIQMIERCHNESHKFYSYYGARGISVCSKWREGFTKFIEDMGEAPLDLSLDRIDNERGYSKDNCRWATKSEQQRNRRNSIYIGEVNNNWEVVDRLKGKTWVICCLRCSRVRPVKSCNVRRLNKCKCINGEINGE